jgi:putative endonuclease
VFYIGVTNDLKRRTSEHFSGLVPGFTTRYRCKYLVYYEKFGEINTAIEREKEMKKWSRIKKVNLIKESNLSMSFLNESIMKTDSEYL